MNLGVFCRSDFTFDLASVIEFDLVFTPDNGLKKSWQTDKISSVNIDQLRNILTRIMPIYHGLT